MTASHEAMKLAKHDLRAATGFVSEKGAVMKEDDGETGRHPMKDSVEFANRGKFAAVEQGRL